MDYAEIFTVVTGIVYIVLEIKQKRAMWLVGMLTSAASMYVFIEKGLYASFALNVYYFVVSLIGIIQWRKDEEKLDGGDKVHLSRMSVGTAVVSAVVAAAGSVALVFVLRHIGDPMSVLDAIIAVCSAVATYWLCKSYLAQWYVWIAVNLLTCIMCLGQELYLMSVLYIGYSLSAVYGLYYWRRNGRYVD